MPPIFDASSNHQQVVANMTNTCSHTPVGIGPNLIAIAVLMTGNATITPAASTYAGNAMTFLTSGVCGGGFAQGVYIWYYLNPPISAQNCIVNWTANNVISDLSVRTYAYVNQTNPLGTPVIANGTGFTPSVTLTGDANQLFIDATASHGTTYTACGQRQRYASTLTPAAVSDADGLASLALSWTINLSSNWVSIGIPLFSAFMGAQGVSLSPSYQI